MPPQFRWGILGAGHIATRFARDLSGASTGRLTAIAARSSDRAEVFAKEFGAEESYGSYVELLADRNVDGVYIATLNDTHASLAIATARAGKHALVEKPFALNAAQAAAVFEAARSAGVLAMEAFMYRMHPQTERLLDLIRSGAIGRVRRIDASFGFQAGARTGRLFENSRGGGALMDVGCYPVSAVMLIAGTVARTSVMPVAMEWSGVLGDTNVDEEARATFEFPDGSIANLTTSIRRELSNDLVVTGDEGSISVPRPWTPTADGKPAKLNFEQGGRSQSEVVETDRGLYAYEADAFAEAVQSGANPTLGPTPDETLVTMTILDRWRSAMGLEFSPERVPATVSGVALRIHSGGAMRHGRIPEWTFPFHEWR